MRRRCDEVGFVASGRWDEASVGTNALALRTRRPSSVYSAEHYSRAVHGWACYAVPLLAPGTGLLLGVLDLSTTWDRAHALVSMSGPQYAYWKHTHLTVDVVEGRGSGFSLEAPRGVRFLLRSRLFDEAESALLEAEGHPPTGPRAESSG